MGTKKLESWQLDKNLKKHRLTVMDTIAYEKGYKDALRKAKKLVKRHMCLPCDYCYGAITSNVRKKNPCDMAHVYLGIKELER
jgi:hypothetical protein